MLRKKWLILFCIFLNSGCLFKPTYQKPAIKVPQKWSKKYLIQAKQPAYLPSLFWWQQFDNPELNTLIQKGLQNNYEVHLALANIEYARSQLEQIKLSWLPNLTLLAGYSQFPVLGNPATTVIAYPAYIVNIIQLYKQQKSAQAVLEASIYAKYCSNLVVIAQVSAGFFMLISQKEALYLEEKRLKDYQIYLKLMQTQYRSDLISLDDIIYLQSQIQQIEAEIAVIKHNIIVSQNALHFLLNENPGTIEIKTSFKNINSNKLVPGNIPASVLEARPDVRRAEALLKAARADVGAAKANLLPSVNLGAFLGYGTRVDGIKLGQAYLNGPVFDLPLFAQIDSSKAQYKAEYIKYVTTIRAALRDVTNDLSAYSAYSEQLDKMNSALLKEMKLCYLSEVRYRDGLEDNLGVIKCKIRMDEFRLMVNDNKLKKMIALVTLYQSLAGGYSDT